MPGLAPGDPLSGEHDQDRSGERREQADPGRRRSSAQLAQSGRRRGRACVVPWPRSARARRRPRTPRRPSPRARRSGRRPSRCWRANATSARFAALSMISSESSTISGLRRSITPSAPIPKSTAETARYQGTSGPITRASSSAAFVPSTTPPDCGDEQHDRRDLEREQMIGQEEAADLRRAAERARDRRRSEKSSPACDQHRDDDLDEERRGRDDGGELEPARPARPGRVGAAAEVRDHEEEHHHHRARVDEHLRGGDELRGRAQEEHGERAEVPDQRERGVERVREGHDGEAGAEARRARPRSRSPRRGSSHRLTTRSCRPGSGVSKRPGPATGTRLIGSARSMSFV